MPAASAPSARSAIPRTRLAYVFGTSSCTMTTTREPVFVPGVWGPVFLGDGAGRVAQRRRPVGGRRRDRPPAVDASASRRFRATAAQDGLSPARLAGPRGGSSRRRRPSQAAWLAGPVVVVPEFLGNRAPFADPQRPRGDCRPRHGNRPRQPARLYVAGLCGIGYGLRQIIAAQEGGRRAGPTHPDQRRGRADRPSSGNCWPTQPESPSIP